MTIGTKATNLRVGYLVETPITLEKRMFGAQISFLAMLERLTVRGVKPFVVMSEEWELSEAVRNAGCDVLIAPIWEIFRSLDGVYDSVHDPVDVAEREAQAERDIIGYFRANSVEIVHMNTRFAGLMGARVAHAMAIPYIYHIREFLSDDFGLQFKNPSAALELLSGASSLIAISDAVRDSLVVEYPGARVFRIYNGIDIERYRRSASRNPSPSVTRIAMVGRVVEHKGQLDAIQALESLPLAVRARVHLDIIGCRPEEISPYERMLRDYVAEHQLGTLITFVPFTHDVPAMLSNYEIGLMCSSREAFGRVTVEYMLAELLVIGARSGATSELVTHDVDGYLYESGNIAGLAEQILRAIADPPRTRALAQQAHQSASSRFSAERNADEILTHYADVLRAHPLAHASQS